MTDLRMGAFCSTFFLCVIRVDFDEVGLGRLALAKPGWATLGGVLWPGLAKLGFDEACGGLR